ncbi:MAG: glycosyltransferase [Candidatus Levybacteria bacterium]|nr:glycosyltransferase [Candidatus Levybacteria bacterium]
MNIAFITHNYPLNKEERSNAGIFVADIAINLVKNGHSIIVFVLNADVTKKEVKCDGKLIEYFMGRGSFKKSLGEIKFYNFIDILKIITLFNLNAKSIEQILMENAVDFCLAFWAIPSGIIAYQISKKINVPYGIWALGSDIYIYAKYPIIGNIINKAIRAADLLLADGKNLAETVSNISKKKCVFMPSTTEFSASKMKVIKMNKQDMNFIFLGRMEKIKGPDILLSSISKLPKDKNYHIYFLGGGRLLDTLRKKVVQYGLERRVSFLGNVNDKNIVWSYLSNGDYLVIPSRSDSIPLVLAEGAKAGIPVIVSSVGDMPFLVKKYGIGHIFPSGDIQKLSDIVKMVIKKGKGQGELFKSNLKVFSEEFDINKIGHTLEDKLRNAIGGKE